MSALIRLDWAALNWIYAACRNPILDCVMPKLTALGNDGAIWIALGLALLPFRRFRRLGAVLLVGLAAGALIGNGVLKNVVARPRPCWLNPVPLLIPVPTDYSFPSGHALSSFLAATVLTRAHRRFGYLALPLALLIAFSRLYLYVHFPSDVLFGALLGALLGWVVSRNFL